AGVLRPGAARDESRSTDRFKKRVKRIANCQLPIAEWFCLNRLPKGERPWLASDQLAIGNRHLAMNIMENLLKDLRYGVRSFLKRPGFLAIAVSTLALGIGATTAMFTVVNSVLLRPLAFPDPERIVLLEGVHPRQGITQSNMSAADITDWKQQSQSF